MVYIWIVYYYRNFRKYPCIELSILILNGIIIFFYWIVYFCPKLSVYSKSSISVLNWIFLHWIVYSSLDIVLNCLELYIPESCMDYLSLSWIVRILVDHYHIYFVYILYTYILCIYCLSLSYIICLGLKLFVLVLN